MQAALFLRRWAQKRRPKGRLETHVKGFTLCERGAERQGNPANCRNCGQSVYATEF